MDQHKAVHIIVSAIVVAALLCLLNQELMEKIADRTFQSIELFLRQLDKFAVNYQLMRGNYYDTKGTGESTVNNDS